MTFNSFHFAIFFPIIFILAILLRKRIPARNMLLLIGSYYFYGCWDERFLILILWSTAVDYFAGLGMGGIKHSWGRRFAVTGSIVFASLLLLPSNWPDIFSGKIDWTTIFWPDDVSLRWGLLICVGFAIFWPVVIELYFMLCEKWRRRAFLITSLITNLGLLGVFKYYDFFIESAGELLNSVGMESNLNTLKIILPVGISFYTFQTLSYTIDLFRKRIDTEHNLLNFALFVALFPQLVAGPIERAAHLLPQIRKATEITLWHFHTGFYLICWGLFKKVVFADNAAKVANSVFDAYKDGAMPDGAGATAYMGVLAFAIQIYCDFSGYTDIARGSARLLGFDLMLNFNLPYFAKNPSDFWRRWHISLSTWLRDYLYIPLGGNKKGPVLTYVNLMITMLLGGLWHGARWNFVLWGLYHGLLLAVHRFFQKSIEKRLKFESGFLRDLSKVITTIVFFHFTLYGWLLFRAETGAQIWAMTVSIFTDFGSQSKLLGDNGSTILWASFVTLLAVQMVQYFSKDQMIIFKLPIPVRGIIYALFLLGFILFGEFGEIPFIYFQF